MILRLVAAALSAAILTAGEPSTATLTDEERSAGFVPIFDGTSLAGWKPAHADKFRVEDGCLVSDGTKGRSMIYYVGADGEARVQDFELRAQVRTDRKANSGIYFRTEEEPNGAFPHKNGYEAQIATTHGNPHATGSLYHVVQVAKPPVVDDVWFEYRITVTGRRIVLALDGNVVVDYTEPSDKKTRLTGGRIALQCHEPGIVRYRNLRLRRLPAGDAKAPAAAPEGAP